MDVQDRILDKLDKIEDRLGNIELRQTELNSDVQYHISRTDLAEENTANIKKETDARLQKLEKWYDKFHFLGWFLFAGFGFIEKLDKVKAIFHGLF